MLYLSDLRNVPLYRRRIFRLFRRSTWGEKKLSWVARWNMYIRRDGTVCRAFLRVEIVEKVDNLKASRVRWLVFHLVNVRENDGFSTFNTWSGVLVADKVVNPTISLLREHAKQDITFSLRFNFNFDLTDRYCKRNTEHLCITRISAHKSPTAHYLKYIVTLSNDSALTASPRINCPATGLYDVQKTF